MNKLNKKLVEEMSKLMDELGLTEFEFSDEKIKIKLGKNIFTSHKEDVYSKNSRQVNSNINKESDENENIVKAPLVGTVYLAPEPGSKNFVEVGQDVKIGQVLLIVEAMKTMNEITSHKTGKIKEVFVKNSEPVEFGEPLVLIEWDV